LAADSKSILVVFIIARIIEFVICDNHLVPLSLRHALIRVLVRVEIIFLVLVIGLHPTRETSAWRFAQSFHRWFARASDVFYNGALDLLKIIR
jgi:hypothetical protein